MYQNNKNIDIEVIELIKKVSKDDINNRLGKLINEIKNTKQSKRCLKVKPLFIKYFSKNNLNKKYKTKKKSKNFKVVSPIIFDLPKRNVSSELTVVNKTKKENLSVLELARNSENNIKNSGKLVEDSGNNITKGKVQKDDNIDFDKDSRKRIIKILKSRKNKVNKRKTKILKISDVMKEKCIDKRKNLKIDDRSEMEIPHPSPPLQFKDKKIRKNGK